jgi:hypothetical protein
MNINALEYTFQFKKVQKMQNLGNVYICGSPFVMSRTDAQNGSTWHGLWRITMIYVVPENPVIPVDPVPVVPGFPNTWSRPCLVPSRFQRGERKTRKNSLLSISHHALPGNDITATDLYRLQLHCTVPNEGPAQEADPDLWSGPWTQASPDHPQHLWDGPN